MEDNAVVCMNCGNVFQDFNTENAKARIGHKLTPQIAVIVAIVISILLTLYFALDRLFFLPNKSLQFGGRHCYVFADTCSAGPDDSEDRIAERKFKYNLHVSKKFKICSLVFCGMLLETLLLCMKEGSVTTI